MGIGKYTINGGTGTEGPIIHVEASIAWPNGKPEDLAGIDRRSGRRMYKDKNVPA